MRHYCPGTQIRSLEVHADYEIPPILRHFLDRLATANPGMIDELLDSLVLNRPRTVDELRVELAALCANAADVGPILHSFQDKELLRIGVADLLGKTP